MKFLCDVCKQERDDDEDGGIIIKFTSDETGDTTNLKAICFATEECQRSAMNLIGEKS